MAGEDAGDGCRAAVAADLGAAPAIGQTIPMTFDSANLTPDPWHRLRQLTPARIALGRAGGSLPTRELLDFQLAHALARDAVHLSFDPGQLEGDLVSLGHPMIHLTTAASNRQTYLLRPDLGRTLAEESRQSLPSSRKTDGWDVSLILS